jgi:hypothetical protein
MADVMQERIRSIQRCAGWCFVIGSILVSIAIFVHPSFPEVNQTNLVLSQITRTSGESWMTLRALMIVGFFFVTVGFSALAFLLHLKGSSGSASIVATSALLGGGLWVAFLSAEIYVYRFLANLYGVDPGGATMLFSIIWFWKLAALVVAGMLEFVAVFFAGLAAAKREIVPAWLGLIGALFALIATLYYTMEFSMSMGTGAAIQPMQSPVARYALGLPLQLWLMAVGALLLREYFTSMPVKRIAPVRSGGATGPKTIDAPEKPAPPPQIYPG